MRDTRVHEEHIAVFGESGSGKTVMVSSFYGAMQDRPKDSLYHVVADDIGQGARLHKNYLGMKNSADLPETTRFVATSYSFSVKPKPKLSGSKRRTGPFDDLRVVWHDYPGEWFENGVSGAVEEDRRIEAFKSLLKSDVALLLVDGQKLIDNRGEEQRYLKSLLNNFSNGLLALKNDLLTDGAALDQFPRIWVLALSKSDLLPEMNASAFRELVVEKATDDIEKLRDVLQGLLNYGDFLSIGEDFVLLSSAKFSATKIEVTERVGLNLILPLAAVFATERKFRWAKTMQNGGRVVKILFGGAAAIVAALGGLSVFATQMIKSENKAVKVLGLALAAFGSSLTDFAQLGIKRLEDATRDAERKQENLKATLTEFQLALRVAEADDVLLTSNR